MIWIITFSRSIIPSIGCKICSGYISSQIIGIWSIWRIIFFRNFIKWIFRPQDDDQFTNWVFIWTSVHEQLEALAEFESFHDCFTSFDGSTIELLLVFEFCTEVFHWIDEELSFVDDFIPDCEIFNLIF